MDNDKKIIEVELEKQPYEVELENFANDPEHYVTPGSKRMFRRFTYGYAILAMAAVLGVFALQRETGNRVEDIQASRIEISYDSCLESNDRNTNTIVRVDEILSKRKNEINKQIVESKSPEEKMALEQQIKSLNSSRDTTVSLIDALAPKRDCVAFIIDRFGEPPNLTEQGGE